MKKKDASPCIFQACRLRPRAVPAFWRAVDGHLPMPLPGQFAQWELVLLALHIPYIAPKSALKKSLHQPGVAKARRRLYVPALYVAWAQRELEAFFQEKSSRNRALPVGRHNAHWVLFTLLGLLIWHGVRMGWWSASGGGGHALKIIDYLQSIPAPFPCGLSPEQILEKGSLDVYQVWKRGEWYRTLTALTLHLDSRHLFSNVLFGAVFGVLLCRRVGFGVGFFLCISAGMLGNCFNVLYRPLAYVSLGFSTAVFGMLGALSGVLAEPLMYAHGIQRPASGEVIRRIFLPLAAGVGMLAALGTEGASTDYAAHLFGFAAGFMLGGLWQAIQQCFRPGTRWEYLLGFIAGSLVLASWFFALHG